MSAMLSVREVAELLGIRTESVTALIRANQLVASDVSIKPGGRKTWRIEREEVDSFLRRRTNSPVTPRWRKQRPKNVKKYF